jgi:hypothetical protein
VQEGLKDSNLVASPFVPGPASPCRHPRALSNNRRRAEEFIMSKEQDNKAIVGRWFTEFWGKSWNLKMRFSGTTVLRISNGTIAEQIGLDDGVTALLELGLKGAA